MIGFVTLEYFNLILTCTEMRRGQRIPECFPSYVYQIRPGFSIRTQTRWSMWKLAIAAGVCALIIYLATLTSQSRAILLTGRAAQLPRNTVQQSHWSPPETDWNGQRQDDRGHVRRNRDHTWNHEPQRKQRPQQRPQQRRRRRRLTKREKKQVLETYHYQCSHCHTKLSRFNCDFDHNIPHSYGDIYGGVDDISNLQPLCLICHRKKTMRERQTPEYRSMLRRRRQKIRR
jgi:5-methylcytosine-specific restriction endonuclease McrA